MKFYVKVVDGKWLSKEELTSNDEYAWIKDKGEDAIPSDYVTAVGKINGCRMSVFVTEDLSQVALIIAAVKATTFNKDYCNAIIIKGSQIKNLGLVIDETRGNTPDNELNILHKDIACLTLEELHRLIETFYNNEKRSFASAEIRSIIDQKIKDGEWKNNIDSHYK